MEGEDLGCDAVMKAKNMIKHVNIWGFYGATPIAGWPIRENPSRQMDDDWGYPHLWKPP